MRRTEARLVYPLRSTYEALSAVDSEYGHHTVVEYTV